MIRYADLLLSGRETSEVVREAWRQILAGVARYDGRGSFRSWIFGVVANCAKSRGAAVLRSVQASALAEGTEENAVELDRFFPSGSPNAGEWRTPPEPWPEDCARRPETLHLVRESIDRLPWLGRQVLFLRDVEGWTTGEVSALLGIADHQQRLLLHRARARIRADLERHLAA